MAYLTNCPLCERERVSSECVFCPTCGHNVARGLQKKEKEELSLGSEVNEVVEQNPSVKKTELESRETHMFADGIYIAGIKQQKSNEKEEGNIKKEPLKKPLESLSRFSRNLDICGCIPNPEKVDWFTIDTKQKKLTIQLE